MVDGETDGKGGRMILSCVLLKHGGSEIDPTPNRAVEKMRNPKGVGIKLLSNRKIVSSQTLPH